MTQKETEEVEQSRTVHIHIDLDFSAKVPATLTPVCAKIEDQGQLQRLYEALLADRQALAQYLLLRVVWHCIDFEWDWWYTGLLGTTTTTDETILEPVFNRLSREDLAYFAEQIVDNGFVEALEPLIETLDVSFDRITLAHDIDMLPETR